MTENKYGNVSDAAVLKATGRGWEEWIRLLNTEGAAKLNHTEIARLIVDKKLIEKSRAAMQKQVGTPHRSSAEPSVGWWAQSITVGYEYATGRRVKGETTDQGFEIGVQRTVSRDQQALWDFLMSREGLRLWLGEVTEWKLAPGAPYRTADGTVGEIRTVKESERLRLTWQPPRRTTSTTLQLTLSCPRNTRNRTTLHVHHEKLSGAKERSQMQQHWQVALEKIIQKEAA